jgi:penicillin-binding protein 1B
MAWLVSRRRLTLVALGAASLALLALVALAIYSSIELARFDRVEVRRGALVYAAPQPLALGVHIRLTDLAGTLARLSYTETRSAPSAPGQYRRANGTWEIYLRGLPGAQAQRVRVEVRDERIYKVTRDGSDIGAAALEPEILASAGDRPGEDHRPVRLAEAPLSLLQAVLAAEDHRFFDHAGVDLRGLLRAAWVNVRERRVAQGGSTITQQLVKNRLLDPKRTLLRKLDEAWLATLIEWRYSKERILEAYLNEIYLGQRGPIPIRGVGAASRVYFRKEVHQLTLAESALLAGMIRAPNTYSPIVNPVRARERRDVVLARMRELGRISAADQEAARRAPVTTQTAVAAGQTAPYFSDHVRQELEMRFGDGALDARDVRVYTTLDLTLQRLAERAVARGLERLEAQRPRLRAGDARLQAALVALDPATGQIRAMVGGREYQGSQFNRATLAHRQPGSAFKPFVYAAALAPSGNAGGGFTAATFVDDSPLTLTVNGAPWSPRNYEDRYLGRVSVREALQQSLNAATIRLAQDVGLPVIADRARAFGIESRLEPVPAMVLGAFEVTPLELARAYLPFANGGQRTAPPHAVRAVQDRGGPVEPADDDDEARAVLTPAEAYVMTSLLEGVINAGTGAAARTLGVTGAVAGKTGTTNEARDAWFVGYSPGLLAVVWVGYDNGEPHGMSGAEGALPIWAEFMRPAMETMASRGFTVPAGVTFAEVDLTNGRLANRFCPRTAKEVFVTGTQPEECREHGGIGDRVEEMWKRFRDWLNR